MKSVFTVYVLFSESYDTIYIGQTSDMDKRLDRHNLGLVKSTQAFRPWKTIYTENCDTRAEAMRREKWLKSGIGRDFINKFRRDK